MNPRAGRALRFMRADAQTAIQYATNHPNWLEDQLVTDAIPSASSRWLRWQGSSTRLSCALRHRTFDWDAISGLRNRLVHEYHRLQPRLLQSIVENDLPKLIDSIDDLLGEEEL